MFDVPPSHFSKSAAMLTNAMTMVAISHPMSLPTQERDLLDMTSATDFSKIFDDDGIDMLSDLLEPNANEGLVQGYNDNAPVTIDSDSPTVASFNHPETNHTILVPPQPYQQGVLQSDFNQEYVNLILIVDPVQNIVTCPQQLITYKLGDHVASTLLGPTVFNEFSSDTITELAGSHVISPSPSTNRSSDLCRGESQLVKTPVSPVPFPDAAASSSIILSKSSAYSPPSIQPSPVTSAATSQRSHLNPPLRALSAYNYFFRDERERILNGGQYEWTSTKERQLLRDHWNRDRNKKRRHRKTHGMIDFTTLSKLISSRWKDLPPQGKEFYRQVASKDWERYQQELAAQKTMGELPMSVVA